MSRRPRAAAALALGAVGIVGDGCVIADPPTDIPSLPEMRPTIVRASVVPSASAILSRWPDRFIVPVELLDPRVRIWWTAFVDYNPATGEGLQGAPMPSDFPANTRDRTRILEILIPTPSLDGCHLVEVVVALRRGNTASSAHSPDEPGGDTVSWFFNPSGDPAGCPVVDAGLPPPSDAAPDEGGTGTQ